MPNSPTELLELYKFYQATAEKVSDRRAQANSWMLSVNTALVGVYGYFDKVKGLAHDPVTVWVWGIPLAGLLICMAWLALLSSYRKLNKAKYQLLQDMEKDLSVALFTRERDIYKGLRRRSLTRIEVYVPWGFMALYVALCVVNVSS